MPPRAGRSRPSSAGRCPRPDGRQVVFRAWPHGRRGGSRLGHAVGSAARVADGPAARRDRGGRRATSLPGLPTAGRPGVLRRRGAPQAQPGRRDGAEDLRRCRTAGNGGTDWNEAGTILFSAGGWRGRIYSVAATGGEAKPLTTLDTSRGETNHHAPQFLPDGRRFLFRIGGGEQDRRCSTWPRSMAPSERQQVAAGLGAPRLRRGAPALRRATAPSSLSPSTPRRAALSGEPVAIASSVATWTVSADLAWFGTSPAGTLAYFSGAGASGQVQLAWLDRKGAQIGDGRSAGGLRPVHPLARREERGPRGPGREAGVRPLGDGRRARRRRAA